MEAEPFGSTLSIVPRGFEAYARIFHPVHRDRPRDTKTWQGIDEFKYFDGIRDINASLETQQITWAQAAAIWEGWGGLVSAAGAAYDPIESDDLRAARASTTAGRL